MFLYNWKGKSTNVFKFCSASWFPKNSPEKLYHNFLCNFRILVNSENNEIKVGDIITHETLGTGVVVNMNGDLIDVAFKSGIKKLMKNHKSITKL